MVVASDPPAGSSVAKGSKVTLSVSKGPATTQIPDVSGQHQADATSILEGAGLNVAVIIDQVTDPSQDGIVLSTNPPAGADAKNGEIVTIHVGQLSFAGGETEGNVTLRWRAAGSALTHLSPLGEYELRLDGGGTMVHASLSTLSGPLQLDGKGSWKHGDRVAFLATARVPPQHREQLAPLLRLIAVETGKGVFELQLK